MPELVVTAKNSLEMVGICLEAWQKGRTGAPYNGIKAEFKNFRKERLIILVYSQSQCIEQRETALVV